MRCKSYLFYLCLVASTAIAIEGNSSAVVTTSSFVAQVQAHTPSELDSILRRVDELLKGEADYSASSPVAVILHGAEIQAFLKSNYQQNHALVDLAARLDAYNAVDIQVCETWMRLNDVERSQLPPFVSTVPYGPAAEAELVGQGYEYF